MTKQTQKTIEDYPELELKLHKMTDVMCNAVGENCFHYIDFDSVGSLVVEMQSRIDSLTEQNKELQEQINFKIDECITLAKACNRWKENALNKESK